MPGTEGPESAYQRGANLEELWKAILEQPQNDERHQRFLRFCVLSQRHDDATARYNAMRALGEDYEPIVDRYQKQLALQVAAHTLARTPTRQVDRKRARLGWLLIGTGITFSVGLLVTESLVGLVGPVALFIGVMEVRQSRG